MTIKKSCMFSTYHASATNKSDDLVIVKEKHLDTETGIETPVLRFIENYQRQFWVTKKEYRDHNTKREWEYRDRTDEYRSNSASLSNKIKNVLGINQQYMGLREVCNSPYVYGADVSSSVLVMDELNKQYDHFEYQPDMTYAVLDFETDVVHGHEQIISGSLTFKDKAMLAIVSDFINPQEDAKVRAMVDKYLGKDFVERGIKLEIVYTKTAYGVARRLMDKAHELKPDVLGIWNMNFDINKMIKACDEVGQDPSSLFCDPAVPYEYRKFSYREDLPNKVTASGKKQNKGIADVWHTVEAPSSFYIIDAMCLFRSLRVVEGMRRSYSLDAILSDELGIRKLDIEIPGLGKTHNLDWHREMQRNHKFEYMAYNIFDTISMEMLDEKVKDIAKKLKPFADGSEFSQIKSNPRRLANCLHFFLLEKGKVIATTGKEMREETDRFVLGKRDWVITLANELTKQHGAQIFDPQYSCDLLSRIAVYIFDNDIASGYPNGQLATNNAKETTLVEVSAIRGKGEETLRRIAVNMTNPTGNAISICTEALGLPPIDEAIYMFGEYEKTDLINRTTH
jgi:hypothetical protein